MAANDIPALSTSNTFGHLLVATNALIKQANLLNSGTYVKEAGDLKVLAGAISLDKTSGVTLTVASDATFGGQISSKTIVNSGDLTVQGQTVLFSNTSGTVTVRNNLVSSNVFANNITSNVQLSAQNVSINGYLLATGTNLDAAPTISSFSEKAAVNVANKVFVSNTGNVEIQGTLVLSKTGTSLNVRSNSLFAGEVALRSGLPTVNISSSGNLSILQFQSTTGTTDNNIWHLKTVDSSGKLRLQAMTDALSGGGSILDINRNAQQITGVVLTTSSSNDSFRITQTGTGYAFVVEDEANPDGTPFVIDAGGNVGIGTTATGFAKIASRRDSSRTESEYGIYSTVRSSSTGGSNNKFAIQGDVATSAGYTGSHFLTAVSGIAGHETTGTISSLRGISTYLQCIGSGTVTNAYQFFTQDAGLGTGGSNTITNLFGYFAADMSSGTNDYAFYSNLSAGTNKWGFYSAGTANNYFNGSVGIGITAPTSKLHVVGDGNITTSLIVSGLNVTPTIISAYGQANLAYAQANSGYTQANAAYAQANTARDQANAAYSQANTALTTAGNGANTVRVSANSGSTQNSVNLNFVNTQNILVSVSPGSANSANVSFNLPSTLASLSVTSLSATTLTVTNPIVAPSESDSASYRLRVSQTTRGDGTFGVNQGGANGNAEIKFASSPGIWQLTSNNLTGTYYTILSSQNVSDSVTTTSSSNVASLTAVKTAYDQGSSAYAQANLAYATANNAANGARVSANSGSTQSNVSLNFVNTATVQVSVTSGGTGVANVAFTSVVSGGVSSVGTGIGLTGGPITSSGTISANIASTTVQGVTKLIDAVNSTDAANAATGAAVKTAYDQATNAYIAANTAANTTAVYANASLILSKAPINFNNTSTVRVTATPSGVNYTNVAFTVVGGAGSGLDADTLDGNNSTSFVRSDATTTGNISLTQVAPYIRLQSNDIDVFSGQEIASILFATTDASVGGTGDKAKISAEAEGTAAGGALNFFTAADGASANIAASIRGNNDFRLYSFGGTNYHAIRSQASSISSLTIPAGDVILKVGTSANVAEVAVAANTARVSANSGSIQNNIAINFNNTSSVQVSVGAGSAGSANVAFSAVSGSTTVPGILQLTDSVTSTSTTTAATPNSVKTAYDQATLGYVQANAAYTQANTARDQANTARDQANAAYAAANTGTNRTQVSANSGSIQSNVAINFVNTATVQVSVGAGSTGNADVSFSINSSPIFNQLYIYTGSNFGNTDTFLSPGGLVLRSNVASAAANAIVNMYASSGGFTTLEMGSTLTNIIDFKNPWADDFDHRISSDATGLTIVAGSSTSAANLLSITSGNVNIDSGTFFVDYLANEVGVGTTTPNAKMDIVGNMIVSHTGTTDALRITQSGTGNAFVIEDSTNPDATPALVVDDAGNSILGYGTAIAGIGITAPAKPTLQLHTTGTTAGKARIGLTYWGQATTQQPAVEFMKAGVGAAINSHIIVANNESIGTLRWGASNGNVFILAATIDGEIDGVPSDSTMPTRIVFNTNSGGTSATEKMRINANGNVGIGNTAPAHKLAVTGNVFASGTLDVRGNVSSVNVQSTGLATLADVKATGNVVSSGTISDTPIVTITGNATYSDNGAGKVIVVNSTSPVTVTFDASSAGASFNGFSVTIVRKNTGTVTIGNTAAIAKLNTSNYTTSNLYSRYSSATVLYTATNEFILFGDIQ